MKFLIVFAICATVASASPVRPHAKPVPISVGPAIVDGGYEPISVGPAIVDGEQPAPIAVGPAIIDSEHQPISVGPAIVDSLPNGENPALVQIIINIDSGAGISGSPVLVEGMPAPVLVIVDEIEPSPVIVVEQPEIEAAPVVVVEQPEIEAAPVVVVEQPEIEAEPVVVIEQPEAEINPLLPEVPIIEVPPIVALPGILN